MLGAWTRNGVRRLQRFIANPLGLLAQFGLILIAALPIEGAAEWAAERSKNITALMRIHDDKHDEILENNEIKDEEQRLNAKNVAAAANDKKAEVTIAAQKKLAAQREKHHHTTATLNQELAEQSSKTATAAQQAKNQAETTAATIRTFRAAEENVNKAYADLRVAFNEYDAMQTKSNAVDKRLQDVHETLLAIIVAEEKLAAKLEMKTMLHQSALKQDANIHQADHQADTIQHKHDLYQEYQQKLTERNHELITLLSAQSAETLDKISRMTEIELKKQHAAIQVLQNDDIEGVEKCQVHIENLQNFLATTEGVMSDKLKEQVITTTPSETEVSSVLPLTSENTIDNDQLPEAEAVLIEPQSTLTNKEKVAFLKLKDQGVHVESIDSKGGATVVIGNQQKAADQFGKSKGPEPYNAGHERVNAETHQNNTYSFIH